MKHAPLLVTTALALGISVFGCDRGGSKSGDDGSAPTDAARAATSPAASEAAPHGPAIYFVLERGGLVMLRDGAFEPVAELKSLAMHDPPIKAPGGGFYVYHAKMLRYDGTLTDLGAAPDTKVSRPHQLTADGKLVATGTTHVGVHDGSAWQTWLVRDELEGVEISNGSVTDAALAPDGTLYASMPTHLAVRSPSGEWKAHEVPIAGNYGGHLAVGADGVVLISLHSKKLNGPSGAFTFKDGTFTKVGSKQLVEPFVEIDGVVHALELGGRAIERLVGGKLETVHDHGRRGLSHLTRGADGKLYALDADRRQVLRIEQGGVTALPGEADELPFSLTEIEDNFDVDAAGRVWLRSRYGVHLIDGDEVVNLLPGPEQPLPSLVQRVVVSGPGPSELPKLESSGLITRTGKVVGKDGAPAAGVAIEICALYVSQDTPVSTTGTFRGKTPCAKSNDVFGQVETDAEGRFTVENTPRLGTISIAYRDGKSWKQFLEKAGLKSCYETRDGQICDVGTIELQG